MDEQPKAKDDPAPQTSGQAASGGRGTGIYLLTLIPYLVILLVVLLAFQFPERSVSTLASVVTDSDPIAENAKLADDLAKAQKDMEALQTTNTSLEKEKAELTSASESLEKDIASAKQDADSLKTQISDLSASKETLEKDASSANEKASSLAKEKEELTKQAEQLQQELSTAKGEIESLTARIKALETPSAAPAAATPPS